jgi:hypothetical protein
MLKLLVPLALTIVIFTQTVPVFGGVSSTMTIQLAVTIPQHVILNSNLVSTPFSNNAFQLVQTQSVIRNLKTISLTSVVVP